MLAQALLAAVIAGAGSFIVLAAVTTIIHHHRNGLTHRYLWGVAVAAILIAIYEFINYLGR